MIGQDVNKQAMAKAIQIQRILENPFPGLRPFTFWESHLFFGQDKITDQIILKLLANKFICLLGGAGTGKTSIINCGIKPIVLSGLLSGPETTWHIFQTQPGNDPMQNLAHVICSDKFNDYFEENQKLQEQICLSILQRGSLGLVELVSQLNLSGDHKFLFIIDQFEDLFKNHPEAGENAFYEEALQYVSLFVEALQSSKQQFYVVVSIRSDFTDDFIIFPSLADYINRSNVIIPRMSRQQLQEAVLGPLRANRISVEDSFLAQILNDCTFTDDMLPRLQHALQRSWESWAGMNNIQKPVSLKEYDSCGGIKNSVSNHLNTIYNDLEEKGKKICETIFKALTERGSGNKGLLRPTSVEELAAIARADISEVTGVIEKFSEKKSEFLTFNTPELQANSIITLSHVSLMRAWNKLREWVEEEAISGQMYIQLSKTAASYQVGKAGLLQTPDLQLAINWKEKQNPTLHWARRYHPAFERTMVYIQTSLENFKAEEALKQKKAHQTIRRIRSFSVILGGTALLAVALTIYSQMLKKKAEQTKMLAIEQKDEAFAKSEKAEKLSKEAFEEKMRAEQAANEAERMRILAIQQNKKLSEQKFIAETTAEQAIRRTAETKKTLEHVFLQKEQIEKQASEINTLKTQAQREKEETFKKRMLTVSQALAIKSQQISGDRNLKAALALHAYQFNNVYGGKEFNPDIYNALSEGLASYDQNIKTIFRGHTAAVKAIVSSPRGNALYSTGGDGNIISWNPEGTSRLIFKNPTGNLCLAVNQTGRYLAAGSDDGSIQIIDLNNTDSPVRLKGHSGPVFSLAFSRDGQLYSSGADRKVIMWNITSGTGIPILTEPVNARALTVSPDGRFLACGCDDGRIILWQPRTEQLSTIASDDGNPVYSIAFNVNSTWLVTGDVKGEIKIWNPFTRKYVTSLKNHTARVMDIAFNTAGDMMATSSYDGSIYIFDVRNLITPPVVLREPLYWILTVAFNSDGSRLFLGTNKPGYLSAYPVRTNVLAEQLCSRSSAGLTTEEWNSYIGNDIKYQKPCE